MSRPARSGCRAAIVASGDAAGREPRTQDRRAASIGPKLAVPESIEPFLKYLEPGSDAFAQEREAQETGRAACASWARALRAGPAKAAIGDRRAARAGLPRRPSARLPTTRRSRPAGRSTCSEDEDCRASRTLDARAFGAEAAAADRDLRRDRRRASSSITAIEPEPGEFLSPSSPTALASAPTCATTSSAPARRRGACSTWACGDMAGAAARRAGRSCRVDGCRSHVIEPRAGPVFTEMTAAALGGNESFRRQLSTDLDAWMATIDSVLTRDSNGHHGVSVGDADGDGLDDLYVAQPAGLPNRLFRARGDGTFEDITERAGLGVLDDTAQSLFADVDNDGDQDLVLATGDAAAALRQRRQGALHASVPDAFRFAQPLQGVLTSIAMADYDRDGFLDLYLCVYSYFFGAGEDKAGTPAPYYDARNGPPGVLFRNDGHGRFVDATREAGLDAGNDRYHFAAAWADYDGDGWPDLLVANDFGTKNLYRNRRAPRRQGDVRGRGRRGGRARPRRRHERGLLRLRQRRPPRHLHRQHLERRRPARDRRADVHAGRPAGGARALPPPRPRQLALPQPRRRPLRGRRRLEARAEMGRWAWSSDALDFDSDGWEDLYVANGMLTRETGSRGPRRLLLAAGRGALAAHARHGHAVRRCVAGDEPAADPRVDRQPPAQRVPAQRRPAAASTMSRARSGSTSTRTDARSRVLDIDRDGDPDLVVMAARQAPQLRVFRNDFAARRARRSPCASTGRDEQPRRDRRAGERRDGYAAPDEGRAGRLRVPLAALEGAALRPGREPAHRRS